MKKIIAMAAMLLAVVVFAYTYRLQTLAWLQLPAFAVTEKDITDTLKADGTPEEDKEVLSMRACTEDEALYRRANRYFIGDKKESVDITYPLFAQEGTALYYLNGDLKLITNDFESYEPYEGMLLSNGTAYDIDGQTAEDEEYILSTAGKGLYINTQPMTVTSSGNESRIRLNSIMYLGDSGIHYYSYDDGRLVYGQTKITYGDTVKIGSVSMSYDEFLKQLGLVAEYSSTEQKIQPETEAETNPADRSDREQRRPGSSGEHANGETVANADTSVTPALPVTPGADGNRQVTRRSMSPAARMEITEAMTAVSIRTAPSQRKAAETAPATPIPAAAPVPREADLRAEAAEAAAAAPAEAEHPTPEAEAEAPEAEVPAEAAEVRPPHPEAAAALTSPETAIPVQTQAMDPPTEAILTYVRMNLRNRQ